MPKSIPARWLEYKPYGTVICGTKILPFKVPLKEAVSNNLEPKKRFTVSVLVQAFPRIKCIIDLTNTDRYYDEKEFTNSGIKYEKIMVRGREVPSVDVMNKRYCRSSLHSRCKPFRIPDLQISRTATGLEARRLLESVRGGSRLPDRAANLSERVAENAARESRHEQDQRGATGKPATSDPKARTVQTPVPDAAKFRGQATRFRERRRPVLAAAAPSAPAAAFRFRRSAASAVSFHATAWHAASASAATGAIAVRPSAADVQAEAVQVRTTAATSHASTATRIPCSRFPATMSVQDREIAAEVTGVKNASATNSSATTASSSPSPSYPTTVAAQAPSDAEATATAETKVASAKWLCDAD
ncbi:uncharacterized protein LOC122530190 isoform X3 [Frieseomelitta varia]|uniref:uncharacterized protein LOC122530190 isoform X3 n=1 Tax=Frieseomelitta varia TaxID=561572 RepID=UPI001CB68F2C|nr:uncharacterized protein LOC122530190 isoform X3 [Frieseomelitta varia]